MKNWLKLDPRSKQPGTSVLGLAFDASRLDGVALRRTNGSLEIKKTFTASLSLDPLTNDAELVGREIRKLLEDAGIRERRCAVCLPLKWALTMQVKLPDLPEEDLESFLRIEAERGFPQAPDALMLSISRFHTPGGEPYATLVAIPRDHIARLEAVLKAARLRPVTFSLSIAALQDAGHDSANDVLALVPGENSVGLQVISGGGVAVLRTLEGALEMEGGEKRVQADLVARETRITLGQLPPDLRDAVRRLRVLGRNDVADELAEQLRPRVEPFGLRVEQVRDYAPNEFGVHLAAGTALSPALSLAARHLTGRGTGFEFLPPKVSAWKQLTTRYSSGKLVWAGAAAGAVVLAGAVALLVQQVLLWHWQSKWTAMAPRVTQLNKMQDQIRKYRPWFDESFRSLSVLRQLTEAFPQEGTVSAKTVLILEGVEDRRPVTTITCTGTARDTQSFNRMHNQLSRARQVKDLHVGQTKGGAGGAPLEFSLNFKWTKPGAQ